MNQLVSNHDSYRFLDKAGFGTANQVGRFVGEVYENALYRDEPVGYGYTSVYIPTRIDLLRAAWDEFESLYMTYLLNGHGGEYGREIRDRVQNFGQPEEEIMDEWADWKSNNASYGLFFTDERTERKLLEDISMSLSLFNISYLNDDSDDNIFHFPEKIKSEDWINPPIVDVW